MKTLATYLILFIAVASASTNFQRANSTTKASASASPSNRVTAKSARSDYHHHGYEHHYPHHYGGHLGFGHYKEIDHYLLPMLVVLGLGVLFMPLISVLMTTMVGNVPVTTLVSGRRRREAAKPVAESTILELLQKVGKAIEVFTKDDK